MFEKRSIEMMQKFPYNLHKRTAASSLSGCIHRFSLRAIILLPTPAKIVDLFEQLLIGGFICVNTRLEFDSKLLIPKNYNGKQKENLKLIFKIEM